MACRTRPSTPASRRHSRTPRSRERLSDSERSNPMIVGRRVKRAVLGTGATLTLLTGLIGFMHTPAGRPMLHWLAGRAGCPVGGHLEPEARDAAILEARQVFKGDAPAASHQALVFTLGETTREASRSW